MMTPRWGEIGNKREKEGSGEWKRKKYQEEGDDDSEDDDDDDDDDDEEDDVEWKDFFFPIFISLFLAFFSDFSMIFVAPFRVEVKWGLLKCHFSLL